MILYQFGKTRQRTISEFGEKTEKTAGEKEPERFESLIHKNKKIDSVHLNTTSDDNGGSGSGDETISEDESEEGSENLQRVMDRKLDMHLRMSQQKYEDDRSRSGSDNSNVSSMDRKAALKLRIVGQFLNASVKGSFVEPNKGNVKSSFAEAGKGGDIYQSKNQAGPNPVTFNKQAKKKKKRTNKSSFISSTSVEELP